MTEQVGIFKKIKSFLSSVFTGVKGLFTATIVLVFMGGMFYGADMYGMVTSAYVSALITLVCGIASFFVDMEREAAKEAAERKLQEEAAWRARRGLRE